MYTGNDFLTHLNLALDLAANQEKEADGFHALYIKEVENNLNKSASTSLTEARKQAANDYYLTLGNALLDVQF